MKKCLSILLALLMILSSMPIMALTASAEQADPNVMADYSVANGNFGVEYYGSVEDSDVTCKGGNGVYVKDCMSQTLFTKVTLEANAEYDFSFNWKAEENEKGAVYPNSIKVYSAKAGDPFDISNWDDSKWPQYQGDTTTYPDLEKGGAYTSQDIANQYTWQSISTSFTTTTDEEYIILIDLTTTNANHQNIYFSDFTLMNPSAASLATPIEQKPVDQWFPWQYSRIYEDTSIAQADGTTSQFRVEMPAYQTIATTVTLTPNTKYNFMFDYYSVTHENGTAGAPTIEGIFVYPYASGDVFNSDSWGEDGYINAAGCADLETGGNYGSGADQWVTAQTGFTTTEETRYNVIIKFNITGKQHQDDQKIYLADFSLEEFVKAKPGNILNNACYANGDVSWSKTVTTADHGDMEARMNFADGLDNPAFSINGGYAWGFGFYYGELTGDTYGYLYINAKGLKAAATYDFSYICRVGFRFAIDSIKCGDNAVTNYIVAPAYENVASPDGKAAQITTAMFTVPVDGDYVITLRVNRDSAYRMPNMEWSTTYLCDLELYERGQMYNVGVSKEGYGNVSADKTGLTEEGTVVTFTAKAELYERFLGWYVGDELVSKELVYTTTVTGDLAPVAKFTAYSENLMADYTVAGGKFVSRYWGSPSDSAVSRYGGNAVYVSDAPHQTFVTKVTLEAGKEYTFSFEWKSAANQYNNLFPARIEVNKINTPEIDILGAQGVAWTDGKGYNGQLGADIETGVNGSYANQDMANTCEWYNITTKFTATESGEYGIFIPLTLDMQDLGDGVTKHYNNKQSIYFSDFVLKTEPVIEYTGTKYDWRGVRWSSVSDSADTFDGGYAYNVTNAMNQNINTTLTLKPGTKYRYSFNWKAVENASGLAFVQASSIYSANSGNPELPTTNDQDPNWGAACNYKFESWGDYTPIYIPNEGYANLVDSASNPNGSAEVDDSVLTNWNTYSATFTTIEDEEYYLFINFGLKNSNGNQSAIISDLVIEEVVEGVAPAGDDMIAHPGVSIRKKTESAYGQALRYKFTVDGDVIANAQADGYELVEYGTVVALADDLVGHAADPIIDATSYTVRYGVAYNVDYGTNIQFEVDPNGDVTYTAALYNIPTENYSSSIAVRPYAKFRNADGDIYVRYGTTRKASVFAVVKEVLAGNNADDIAYVNDTLLAGDIKAAYDAWLAN